MQNKVKLEFMDPKTGELVESNVYTKSASNAVRVELQKLEKKLQVYTVKHSKTAAKEHPKLFKMEEKKGNLEEMLEAQNELSIEEYEAVLSLNEKLADEQIRTLIEELKVMIDIPKSVSKAKLESYQVEQLESTLGKPITVYKDKENGAKNIKYDFWNSQDLDVLGLEKEKFFRRVKL